MLGNQNGVADVKARQAAEQAREGAIAYADGDWAKALTCYFMALALAPDNLNYLHTAVSLIGVTGGYALPSIIKKILGDAAQAPDFNCQALATAVHSEFIYDPLSREFMELASGGGDALEAGLRGSKFDSVLNDALLRAVLQRAVIISPAVETLLTDLRRHALKRCVEGRPSCLMDLRIDFLASLAAQCFNTEYAFDVGDDEKALLETILRDGPPNDPGKIVLIATYRPLFKIFGESTPDAAGHAALEHLLRQQITEPRREKQIEVELPVLTPIASEFSGRMQQQYESFPYPRWFAVDYAKARPFKQVIEERFPDLRFGTLPEDGVDVLIPGCGTGHQVALVASLFRNSRITAFDLSRTSLAYAKRKLDETGMMLKRFGQGDILAVADWEERFDYIECMGVLHHLEDPAQGLDVLTGLLKPSGIVRLGLYSARAREYIDKARQLVADHDLPHTADGVRAARRLIAASPPDDPVREVMESQDYFSIGGLHDLIFNVHECRYTPLTLKQLLDDAGLEFLGFDHANPGVTVGYRERFPDDTAQRDLTNWETFDIEFPDTFGGMYQFWCRPADTA